MLVSLAYEVVDADGRVYETGYDVVRQPPDTWPDAASLSVHGIAPRDTWGKSARPLADTLRRLFGCLERQQPFALVGHDVSGDIQLLVSEAVRCGVVVPRGLVARLVCTRILSTHACALPRYDRPSSSPGEEGRFKWPSLLESYQRLVTDYRPLHRNHDARGDVERCREVFLRLIAAPPGRIGRPCDEPTTNNVSDVGRSDRAGVAGVQSGEIVEVVDGGR